MVDRLRLFLDRPLRDSDRPRLFAAAVAAIVAAAAALALVDDAGPAPTPARDAPASAGPAAPVRPPPALPAAATPTVTNEEGRPARGSIASRREIARAKRVARRFLRSYLRFSYGQASAGAIAGATGSLRRRLAKTRPRVPVQEGRRRPRVLLVQADGVTPARARLLGFVRDGRRRYTVPLALARTRAGWRVTSVGS
jgi:hypothetical protein